MSEIERLIKGSPLTRPIQIGVDSYLRSKFFCIPGFVVDFDESDQTATLQIAIQKVNDVGDFESHPEIISCPVGFAGSDVIFGHKISPGDEGLIYFSQRGVDNWINSGGIVPPMTMRKFDITDAFFDPRFRSMPNIIKGFKNDGAWMATKDGANYFHLKSDGSLDVNVTNTTWKSNSITFDCPTTTFTGTVVSQVVNAVTSLVVAGLEMLTHKHGGVNRGSQNTDGPQ